LVAYIKALNGEFKDSNAYIAGVLNSEDPDSWSYRLAMLYFLQGKKDEGFMWLERALKSRNRNMCYLNLTKEFDSVRSNPRFIAILKEVGLSE
jgi:hypothetical protein